MNDKKYILTVDQSTSSSKAILFDKSGNVCARENVDHKQIYPQSGWVEHDAEEIYQNVCAAIAELKKSYPFSSDDLVSLSISNQRETLVVWDKETGKPIYNAIVWQCQRAEKLCAQLHEQGYASIVQAKSGLILSPNFSAAKLAWILNEVPSARQRAEAGELLMGTIDSWLVWNLSNHSIHATDHSNACRTQLFNIHSLDWDDELLDIFDIPRCMLPEVKASGDIFAYSDINGVLESPIPICGIMGDSNGALFGQNCFEAGKAKITYGTGSSVMMNIGTKPISSKHGLLSSIAWKLNGEVFYVLDGNITCTGATVKWMVHDLELIKSSQESQVLAESIDSNAGVYLVPAFAGLGAPHWNGNVRASITGMTFQSKKAHIVRAGLESIVYQIDDVIQIMEEESGLALDDIYVDGGPTYNDFLMQFQADISSSSVIRSKIEEFSAVGTAYMAGLSLGFWKDMEEISRLRKTDRTFQPNMSSEVRQKNKQGWKKAVNTLLQSK